MANEPPCLAVVENPAWKVASSTHLMRQRVGDKIGLHSRHGSREVSILAVLPSRQGLVLLVPAVAPGPTSTGDISGFPLALCLVHLHFAFHPPHTPAWWYAYYVQYSVQSKRGGFGTCAYENGVPSVGIATTNEHLCRSMARQLSQVFAKQTPNRPRLPPLCSQSSPVSVLYRSRLYLVAGFDTAQVPRVQVLLHRPATPVNQNKEPPPPPFSNITSL
ncbi:uncharacterized protein TRIVIDRAFT_65788 [Trichoderma virens Gv29-8]|uniref:Uncharacterized protein n=1 Tax=Hypocrea virens (strain Gv29-8 / FGSC 10586) TaxID=413071 RepID=G9N917_HYPVG|nr:uncharacterized protein TRIVIDRAFT_65788 [Trichoderma virens Gv29-8]EHK16439.1 hypothetical protein TRIVIDRAFT_65788 [Trichoderma virens Gv29-8]